MVLNCNYTMLKANKFFVIWLADLIDANQRTDQIQVHKKSWRVLKQTHNVTVLTTKFLFFFEIYREKKSTNANKRQD